MSCPQEASAITLDRPRAPPGTAAVIYALRRSTSRAG